MCGVYGKHGVSGYFRRFSCGEKSRQGGDVLYIPQGENVDVDTWRNQTLGTQNGFFRVLEATTPAVTEGSRKQPGEDWRMVSSATNGVQANCDGVQTVSLGLQVHPQKVFRPSKPTPVPLSQKVRLEP